MTLILGQLGLWYQARPLRVGEEAVITLKLGGDAGSPWPAVSLEPTDAVEVTAGPVRVRSKREVCWNVKARQPGSHRLVFQVGDRTIAKELAVGDGFMRVSAERPGWDWSAILLNPWEEPFRPGDPVRSIAIAYPERISWTSGTGCVGDLLVCRLDGRRLVFPRRAERQGLNEVARKRNRRKCMRRDHHRLRAAAFGHLAHDADAGQGRHRGRHRQRPDRRHRQPPGLLRARAGQEDQATTSPGCRSCEGRPSRWSPSSCMSCRRARSTASSSWSATWTR